MQLPQYQSHKKVWALKIAAAERQEDGSVKLAFAHDRFAPIQTDVDWGTRFKPENDDDPGYLVQYEDGYKSWSPTKAFEAGYTRI